MHRVYAALALLLAASCSKQAPSANPGSLSTSSSATSSTSAAGATASASSTTGAGSSTGGASASSASSSSSTSGSTSSAASSSVAASTSSSASATSSTAGSGGTSTGSTGTASASTTSSSGGTSGSPAPASRLLQFGGSLPSPATYAQGAASFSQYPFAGAVVSLSGGEFLFRKAPYPATNFDADRTSLTSVAVPGLTDTFVRMMGTMENGWDWFSDADWASAEANARAIVDVARDAQLPGIVFDPEAYTSYGHSAWTFSAQPCAASSTFAACQAQVRLRGAQFMTALQQELPTVKVFFTGGLSFLSSLLYDAQANPVSSVSQSALQAHPYALLPAFINGMLDAIGPDALLIDGDESSYYYRRSHPSQLPGADTSPFQDTDQFTRGRNLITQVALALVDPANVARYQAQVKVAEAVYVDGLMNLLNSSYPPYFGYYLASDAERAQELEHNTYNALRVSDGYVWVYAETVSQIDWWSGRLPAGVESALRSALDAYDAGQPLGFDEDPMVTAAEVSMLIITGTIAWPDGGPASGVKVSGVTDGVAPGTERIYTRASDATGLYLVYVKAPWSGTVAPVDAGLAYSPPSRHYAGLTTKVSGQDFTQLP